MEILAKLLSSLRNAVLIGFGIVVLFLILYGGYDGEFDHAFGTFFMRWLHVLSGVMWIGLLWYFNFVQIPNMPDIPDAQKPAISKVIAPAALWWFRWGAMATILTGLLLAWMSGYLLDTLLLGFYWGVEKHLVLGLGMWFGIIMFLNVWLIIWPSQRIALGIVNAEASAKPLAARRAMVFSRINTVLSIPMLFAMVAAQNIY